MRPLPLQAAGAEGRPLPLHWGKGAKAEVLSYAAGEIIPTVSQEDKEGQTWGCGEREGQGGRKRKSKEKKEELRREGGRGHGERGMGLFTGVCDQALC